MKKLWELKEKNSKTNEKKNSNSLRGNLLNTLLNIWDSLAALILESLGYIAVATAKCFHCFSNGYPIEKESSLKTRTLKFYFGPIWK
jgi:hypothetical protein